MGVIEARRRILLSAPHPVTTTPAPVASFDTDMVGKLRSAKFGFLPVQDLHGYDSPWPAGGGANILDLEAYIKSRTTDYSVDDDGWITINNLGNAGLYANHWTVGELANRSSIILIDSARTTATNVTLRLYNGTSPVANVTAKDENRQFDNIGFNWSANGSATVKVAIVNAATISAWTPYSNICPITGWDGLTVEQAGKNLLDTSDTTHSAYNIGSIPNILKPNTTYTFSVNGSTTNKFRLYTAKSTAPLSALTPLNRGYISKSDGAHTFTTPSTIDDLLCLAGNRNSAGNESLANILPQVELGSTATTYEPYVGSTYPVSWESEAGTVYGGYVDLVKGKVVAEWAGYTITGNENFSETSTGQKILITPNVNSIGGIKPAAPNIVCDAISTFAEAKTYASLNVAGSTDGFGFGTNSYIIVGSNQYANWNSLVGEKIVFKLATPIAYAITPQIIKSLKGMNNLWSNANGNIDLSYWTH